MRTAPTSNSARFAAKPLTYGGTPAPLWLAAFERAPLPALDPAGLQRLIVVAPHPDDETLGLGATIAQLVAAGTDVQVVSVSDGGAAQPGTTVSGRIRLSTTRRYEMRRATNILGVPPPMRLGLPDGELARHEERLTGALVEILRTAGPGTWCAATWRGDGHPDHEAVGRAAAAACECAGIALLEYPVWMWHWATPADPVVPWDRARSVPAPGWAVNLKRQAVQCYRSQFRPGRGGTTPVLPPFVLQRLLTVGEVIFQ
ncbi:LmbE family protein [Mycobacterium sp. E3251]|uniref:PIG-L deacetylase family protein n=1 Tax=unclassified Mycobacterium TaxID=2642494 RepID=UPI0007FCD375|nr:MULTISPECIES: PIG-L family deacetylase [unclassified Mycobacterium]OBG90714.1 LmbE family protein [Mycobacterium sp. E3251]OBI33290.1 LmbE family protein [Mycobacterium sp. E1386]